MQVVRFILAHERRQANFKTSRNMTKDDKLKKLINEHQHLPFIPNLSPFRRQVKNYTYRTHCTRTLYDVTSGGVWGERG
jgi:predicted SprT family Zn-dependent metalloprotease